MQEMVVLLEKTVEEMMVLVEETAAQEQETVISLEKMVFLKKIVALSEEVVDQVVELIQQC